MAGPTIETGVNQQYIPRETDLAPETGPKPSDPRLLGLRDTSNMRDDSQQRCPKCVGCMHNEMQLVWLDTLMGISGYFRAFRRPPPADENPPLPLLARRWIVAEEQGLDLVSYTRGLVAHEASPACLDVPRRTWEYFNRLPPPQPYKNAKHNIGQVEATDYFGPFVAHIPPDDNREKDSETSFGSTSTASRMSIDDLEILENPEPIESWEELDSYEDMEEDALLDGPEFEYFGTDTSWEHIEPPMTPSVFLPPPDEQGWANFNMPSNELARSGADVGRKRSCAMQDQQQDENSVEKRMRLDDPST